MDDIYFEEKQERDFERNSSNENYGEAKEDTKRLVKPKIPVKRPQIKLDAQKLTGNRGIGVLKSVCKEISFKGKDHELKDLNKTMTHLEHWAHCLFPRMTFDDFLDKVEDLGSKRAVRTLVTKIRMGLEDIEMDLLANEKKKLDMKLQLERNWEVAADRLQAKYEKRMARELEKKNQVSPVET